MTTSASVSPPPGREGVQVGLLLPTSEPHVLDHTHPGRRLVELAGRAEALGFNSVWAGESMSSARFEPLTVLATVAAATESVTIGTASMIPAYRQPVATAQAIATLDRISDGRLVLGVGAGYPSPKTRASLTLAGAPYERRVTLLDDITSLWRHMWTGGPPTFTGSILDVADLPPVSADSVNGPPIWLASATPRALQRTGQAYDGWLPYPTAPTDYLAGIQAIRRAAANIGREPTAVTASLFVTVLVTDDPQQGREEVERFCLATYGLPLTVIEQIQLVIIGPGPTIADTLTPYIDAGVSHIIARAATLNDEDQPERIADIALFSLRASP